MTSRAKLMTIRKFEKILPKICGKDTSFDPKGWTKENPFWGHCAVVSLLAQSVFGGLILGVSLQDTKFAKMKFHFWICFLNERQKDFTRAQFGAEYPGATEIMVFDKEDILAIENTARRYRILLERFEDECKKISRK